MMSIEEAAFIELTRQKADRLPRQKCASMKSVKASTPASRTRFWVDVIIAAIIVAAFTWAIFAH
jgi:hypothetical protein